MVMFGTCTQNRGKLQDWRRVGQNKAYRKLSTFRSEYLHTEKINCCLFYFPCLDTLIPNMIGLA